MDGHAVLDVVGGEGLRVLHDLAGKDEAEVLQGGVAKLARDGLLELKPGKNEYYNKFLAFIFVARRSV